MNERYPLQAFDAASPGEVEDALERAEVVYFERSPIELPLQADLAFLRDGLPGELKTKNLSYHPESDSVPRFAAAPEIQRRVEQILRGHGRRVEAYLRRTLPDYVRGWTMGTTSFRPAEERGRRLEPRSSNELVHVDAGAYGATNGARILRFFVNVHPERERVWGTKGSFGSLMQTYEELWEAARGSRERLLLAKTPLDRLYSGLVAGAGKLYPLVKVIDSSPYDRAMRRIHNHMKEAASFRDNPAGYREIHFPPMASWMVFTDGISHSVLTGQYALVTTLLVPLENCRNPALSPYHILAADARRHSRFPADSRSIGNAP
ncbi:MAG TPA: Kdo hydroxylase family protein [Gammaproteobacteria bacterium]|nr:Kdo hydroxylase family protein [Gammaproteobacteria bacterium]